MPLTPREEECLGFIAAYTDREGRPPFQDEIADHIGASHAALSVAF
jgi:hypothetical protein